MSDDIVLLESKYENGMILIAGDLNARTAEQADFVVLREHETDHLDFPDVREFEMANVQKRVSKDKNITNENGANLLNLCKDSGYVLLNGPAGKDRNLGEYTYVGPSGSSVIDYMLCKPCYLDKIDDFEVLPPSLYSDHCPLRLCLKLHCTKPPKGEIYSGVNKKYQWYSEKMSEFVEALGKDDVQDQLSVLFTPESGDLGASEQVDKRVNEFTAIIQKTADPYFAKYTQIKKY